MKSSSDKRLDVFLIYDEKFVKVKPGYFRNFLEPKGLAVMATKKVINTVHTNRNKIEEEKQSQSQMANVINNRTLNFEHTKSAFKSLKVTASSVIEAINEEYNLHLTKDNFVGFLVETSHKLFKEVHQAGLYKAKIRFRYGFSATVNVNVVERAYG